MLHPTIAPTRPPLAAPALPHLRANCATDAGSFRGLAAKLGFRPGGREMTLSGARGLLLASASSYVRQDETRGYGRPIEPES